jgi:hypothetical protein
MFRLVVTVVVTLAPLALGAQRADLLTRAADEVKEAVAELEEAPGTCRKKLSSPVESLDQALRAARQPAAGEGSIRAARKAADRAADLAREACSGGVGKRLVKALDGASQALDEALSAKDEVAPPPILGALAQGLGGLFAGAAQQQTESSSKEWSKSSRTEQVNGRDLEPEEPPEAAPRAKKPTRDGPTAGEFGATCRRNSECNSNTCYVGSGQLGFCTKMCSDDRDCPGRAFEWSCHRPTNLNAPQKLCLQAKD